MNSQRCNSTLRHTVTFQCCETVKCSSIHRRSGDFYIAAALVLLKLEGQFTVDTANAGVDVIFSILFKMLNSSHNFWVQRKCTHSVI